MEEQRSDKVFTWSGCLKTKSSHVGLVSSHVDGGGKSSGLACFDAKDNGLFRHFKKILGVFES